MPRFESNFYIPHVLKENKSIPTTLNEMEFPSHIY